MLSIKKSPDRRKPTPLTALPLFAWADAQVSNPLTPGGRWISGRTGLPPRLADAHAQANGFGIRGLY